MDESASSLVGQNIWISFTKDDVSHVFGIPCGGKIVLDSRVHNRDAKQRVLDQYLGQPFREVRSIKMVQHIVERKYNEPMSKAEEADFKVAFVVFVCSTLLSPSSKHDYASIDYWNAIQDADSISKYDWSEYVLQRLKDAVTKLRQDVSSSIKAPNITGCSMFLQVLYLDSVELGALSMAQNSFPRVREFAYDKYRAMVDVVDADKSFMRYCSGDADAPHGKLRSPDECCYSWAGLVHRRPDSDGNGCLNAIWDTAVAMVRVLNIPVEAAGPLFVAAADFNDQINSGIAVTGIAVTKFMNVLVSIMLPYTRGFSYQFSHCDNSHLSCGSAPNALLSAMSSGMNFLSIPFGSRVKSKQLECNRRLPCNGLTCATCFGCGSSCTTAVTKSGGHSNAIANYPRSVVNVGGSPVEDIMDTWRQPSVPSLDGMSHQLEVNLRVATAMSQFYGIVQKLKPPTGIDLNSSEYDGSTSSGDVLMVPCHSVRDIPSPWQLGFSWDLHGGEVLVVYRNLPRLVDDERVIILHRMPKLIRISCRALCVQLLGRSEIELDLFDAFIRLFKQHDDSLYEQFGRARWRYFFESDFMATIIAGAFDFSDLNLLEALNIDKGTYDLAECKLLVFPALLQHQWVVYAWSLDVNVIHVFDPSYGSHVVNTRFELHQRASNLLKVAMQLVGRSLCLSWTHNWCGADLRLFTLPKASADRWNRSGILCAVFCRCFDGYGISPSLNSVVIDDVVGKIAEKIISLKGNCATIPSGLLV